MARRHMEEYFKRMLGFVARLTFPGLSKLRARSLSKLALSLVAAITFSINCGEHRFPDPIKDVELELLHV